MKLFIILSVIALSYGDKLDRTYLPPASAGTAGGSPGALTAPGPANGPRGQQGFGQQPFGQSAVGVNGPSGQQNIASPFGQSGANQPSPIYGQPGRGPAVSNGQSASGPSFNQPALGANAGANANAGFGPSNAYITPSNAFGQSPAGNAYNQQSSSRQPQQGFAQGQGAGSFAPQSFQPERAQAAADRSAEILRSTNENDGERFEYSFETSNGISAEESGVATDGVKAQGGYSYTGDDGKAYTVTYTADENGYQPQGEHLPTPHPIPEEILKSIEKNAQAAAAGTQEGAYRPEEYENEGGAQGYPSGPYNAAQSQSQVQGPSQQYGAPSANGRPSSGTFGYQPQNNQPTGSQGQGFGQNIPSGQPGQFNKPSLTDALNQALNQPSNAASFNGQQNQGQFNGASQNIASGQNGQASGYQYNHPQNNQYSSGSNQGPAGSSRPQFNAPSNGISGPSGRPTGSASNGYSSPSGQGQYQSGPQAPIRGQQGQTSRPAGSSRPISGQGNQYQPGSNQGQYQSGSAGQGYNYQSPSSSLGSSQPNRPVSNQGQYQPGSGPSANRPGANQQYQAGNQFQSGSPNQAQNQPSNGQYQANRPSGFNGQGSQSSPANLGNNQSPQGQQFGAQSQYQSGQNQPSSGPQGIQAPYQYNRPTQTLNGPQGQGSQPGSKTPEQFGGPRQPPSFNSQDGYTY